MKSPQPRSSSQVVVAAVRSELDRLLEALRGLAGPGLRPALVPVPVVGPPARRSELPRPTPLRMVFGRRKDGPPQDEAQEDDVPEAPDSEEEAAIPPIPSAAGPAEPSEESGPDETASSWSPLDTAAAGSVPDEPDEQEPPEVAPESDLPAWGVRPFADQEPPQAAEADASALWGTGVGEEESATFSPAVLDSSSGTAEHLGWLQPGPVETEPWGCRGRSRPTQQGRGLRVRTHRSRGGGRDRRRGAGRGDARR
jgi:hypothetical protein